MLEFLLQKAISFFDSRIRIFIIDLKFFFLKIDK